MPYFLLMITFIRSSDVFSRCLTSRFVIFLSTFDTAFFYLNVYLCYLIISNAPRFTGNRDKWCEGFNLAT